MNLNRYGITGLALLGGLTNTGCTGEPTPQNVQRPNILIAIADDMSFPHASAYGCEWVRTPAFDKVASHGVLFTNAYTHNAKSAPSRACLLTGQYSWQLEEAGNHLGFWPEGKFPTIFETLRDNGYRTGFTGKGWIPGKPGNNPDGTPRRLTGEPYQQHRAEAPTKHISNIDYTANFRQFLEENDDGEPWLFWYGGNEPHRHYEYGTGAALGGKSVSDIDRVPGFWPDNNVVLNDMLDYAFEIEHFDMHLGRILEELEARGELDNTIIIVTADNGMPFPRAKGLEYEYSNHLPFVVMWPLGLKNPGRMEDGYVGFIDVVPTLLELAGVSESGMNPSGTSLTDVIYDKPGCKREQVVLCQERHDYGRPNNQGYPIRSIVRNGFLYLYNFKPELWPAGDPETGYLNTDGSPTKTEVLNMRRLGTDHRYWDMCFGRHPQEELYNVTADPDCLINLAGNTAYAAQQADLKKKLFAELHKYNDPRVLGNGDVFDSYPFGWESANWFYERFMNGEIETYQTGWVNADDYEAGPVE